MAEEAFGHIYLGFGESLLRLANKPISSITVSLVLNFLPDSGMAGRFGASFHGAELFGYIECNAELAKRKFTRGKPHYTSRS